MPSNCRRTGAELAQLQSQVLPFPSAEAEAIVARELGQPISTLYAEFDMEPAGGRFHGPGAQAVLPGGQKVVVKIQRRTSMSPCAPT
ncbi:MAG: hypothetical protein IPK16_26120 [Anaerolineales bacterium]|nr:hypothetical protein [Anaerolineales bacterium]